MPSRKRLYATWTAATILLVAGGFAFVAALAEARDADHAVQQAGLSWLLLLATVLFFAGGSLLTPTIAFVARRRKFRKVLKAEGTTTVPLLATRA